MIANAFAYTLSTSQGNAAATKPEKVIPRPLLCQPDRRLATLVKIKHQHIGTWRRSRGAALMIHPP
jgi:hypothetical protein